MNRRFHIGQAAWGLIALWTLLCIGLGWHAYSHHQSAMREHAIAEARSRFEIRQALRLWATAHGGVYVPAMERTPPDPLLAHLAERDIQTPSGKRLTLIAPAVMLRQAMADNSERSGVKAHLTSLKPMRAEDGPDDWERAALSRFEQGELEAFTFTKIEGRPYLRFMRPVIAQNGCLKCHAHQGYKEGDPCGGVSLCVPMVPRIDSVHNDIIDHTTAFGVVWVVGLVGIGLSAGRIRWRTHLQDAAEKQRDELIVTLEAKNDELAQYAHTVAHDLKSPLITIQGYLGLLKGDLAGHKEESIANDIARMSDASENMLALLEGLLKVSRIGQVIDRREDVSLEELAHGAVALLSSQIDSRGVTVDIASNLPVVSGDRQRLLQVLQNLIGNSVKYMGDQAQPRIEIGARRDGAETVCFVRDNGIGIAPSMQELIFGLFHQLDPNAEGTGIGLALVQRIIDVHGGRLWVESKGPGHGTTFCFTVPPESDSDKL